jgi:hypothetical protein
MIEPILEWIFNDTVVPVDYHNFVKDSIALIIKNHSIPPVKTQQYQ